LKDNIDELHYKLNKGEEYFYNRIWINEELGRMRVGAHKITNGDKWKIHLETTSTV